MAFRRSPAMIESRRIAGGSRRSETALLHESSYAHIKCAHSRTSSDADGLRASKLKHAVGRCCTNFKRPNP